MLLTLVSSTMLMACGAGGGDNSNSVTSELAQPAGIRTLTEKEILPVLFPGGHFDGSAFAVSDPEMKAATEVDAGHVAIDTIIHFKQAGMEKVALVMSHYLLEDGQRQTARIYLNSLSCAVLTKGENGLWEPSALKKYIMNINADPWFMMPAVEQAGKDSWILRTASVIDFAGMDEPSVEVAYMDVRTLDRVLTTTIGEDASFLPSEKEWFDVVVQRPKGKVEFVYSNATMNYSAAQGR
jgi:hypothetical protein